MTNYGLSNRDKEADISYDMSDAIRFSNFKEIEQREWEIRNGVFHGTFTELRNKHCNVVHSHIFCSSDCCLRTKHDGTSFLSLGVVHKGYVEFEQNKCHYSWLQEETNIMIGANYHDEYNFFKKGNDFEMTNLVVAPSLFHDMAERCPDIFGEPFSRMEKGETFFLSPQNIRCSSRMNNCLNAIPLAKEMGNCSEMYLESKIQEALSLFIMNYRDELKEKTVSFPSAIESKMQDVRAILQKEYDKPHSLHELAQRAGTNECTLKSAFRQFFHSTVFAYLFGIRMEKASAFLSDTDKSIAEIAALTGYEHASHFCTAFRRQHGISPLEYRRIKRGGFSKNKPSK
ncbi:helix-turn-helix transcriptional regulator [uncultured Bacteroides sp.]|uniref:helix-turn-helix transcriptional regulator n=1 Tax=uncultured Bacteroides sp. TaxID=162156 RepID=UPI002674E4D2|nr:AraC family transcriptional regulator [uncultured Bacteroides sp.]